MKPILITVVLAMMFLFFLKANVGSKPDEIESEKFRNPIRTVEIQCAEPVNGVIYGGLPPCEYFPSYKNKPSKKQPYIVNDKAYASFSDYQNKRVMKQNAEAQAYAEYKNEYRRGLSEHLDTQREISYARTRKKVAERDAKNDAYLAKKKEIKQLSKKARKAKSRVVKCKHPSGEVYYANNCSTSEEEKQLRIVKLPKRDYQKRATYTENRANKIANDAQTRSTITYKQPKQKQYASLAEREKDTRKYYEKMFRDSGFSEANKQKKIDHYVNKSMSLYD